MRCKVIEQMEKSRYLVEFPAQKNERSNFWAFQEEFFLLSGQKNIQKLDRVLP